MLSDNRIDMGEGRVFPILLRLGAPAMISMFFETLYSLVDAVFVAKLGTIPLAAMSLAIPLLFIAMSLCKGVAVGALATMSHARGSGDHREAGEIAQSAFPLTFLSISFLLLLALPACNRPLFALFDNQPQLLDETGRYTFWLVLSFPFMGLTMLCEAIFFSYGDSKTPMQAMIAGNLLNIVLDPILIFSCGLGVAGASLASLMGWILSGVMMARALSRRKLDGPGFKFSRRHFPNWRKIAVLGAPVSLSMLIIPASTATLNYLLAGCGPAYVGAWNLSARIERMIVLPLYGLSNALIPFISFNLGRKRFDRIRESCRTALFCSYVFVIPAAIFFWFQAGSLIALFQPSPEVLKHSAFALKITSLGFLFIPFELIMLGLTQGLKRPKFALLINFLRLIIVKIPLALIFLKLWGGDGIYISHPVSFVVSGISSFIIIRYLLKQESAPQAG